jgi:hypothetical protein
MRGDEAAALSGFSSTSAGAVPRSLRRDKPGPPGRTKASVPTRDSGGRVTSVTTNREAILTQ